MSSRAIIIVWLMAVLFFIACGLFFVARDLNSILRHDIASADLSQTKEGATLTEQTNSDQLLAAKLPVAENLITMIAVGDVSFSRQVEKKIKENNNPDYPLLKIKDYLSAADFVFGNLETAITPGRPIQTGEMIFRSNTSTAVVLANNNFKIVSLANNHTMNFGSAGLEDTLDYLSAIGLKTVGAGLDAAAAYAPIYFETQGIKFAFLAYNDPSIVPVSYEAGTKMPGTAFMDLEKMTAAIIAAKEQADLIIVSLHAGDEYTASPNEEQRDFARAAIEAGADLVIGHHPHVVQTLEKYQDKYIFYSLGNFVFDQMWSEETRHGLAVKFYFNKTGVVKIGLMPVVIDDFCQPRPAVEEEVTEIVKRLKYDYNDSRIFVENIL